MSTETLRDADLSKLAAVLNSQRARAVDVVAPASQLRSQNGRLIVAGTEAELTEDGVTPTAGCYRPGGVADEGLADKLGVPLAYLRKLHTLRPDLYDANINGWLHGGAGAAPDPRKFLLRLLRAADRDTLAGTDDGAHGIVRAVLSDGYRTIDNLDVVLAALDGIRQAGADGDGLTIKADLSERRMYVRVTSTAIAAQALALVRDYRDPGTGRSGRDYPLMFAGLVISNSEVGVGAFDITPRVVLQVCTNGQTMSRDAMRKVHVGGRLDEGVIQWSAETHQRNLALIRSQTADAVRAFMTASYVQKVVDELARQAGVEITDPQTVITTVSKRLGFTQDQQTEILNAFIKGADVTAGGVMHAVTYVAQQQPDGDVAADLEDKAVTAMAYAAQAAR